MGSASSARLAPGPLRPLLGLGLSLPDDRSCWRHPPACPAASPASFTHTTHWGLACPAVCMHGHGVSSGPRGEFCPSPQLRFVYPSARCGALLLPLVFGAHASGCYKLSGMVFFHMDTCFCKYPRVGLPGQVIRVCLTLSASCRTVFQIGWSTQGNAAQGQRLERLTSEAAGWSPRTSAGAGKDR